MRYTPMKYTPMKYMLMRYMPMKYMPREICAYERFCEDLARQNIVAHLSQLQLGFGVVTYGFQSSL